MEVGVAGVDDADAMLSHESHRVRVVKQVAEAEKYDAILQEAIYIRTRDRKIVSDDLAHHIACGLCGPQWDADLRLVPRSAQEQHQLPGDDEPLLIAPRQGSRA